MDANLSMTSHIELSEVGELTNLRWPRLQLVLTELKQKGGDEEEISLHFILIKTNENQITV